MCIHTHTISIGRKPIHAHTVAVGVLLKHIDLLQHWHCCNTCRVPIIVTRCPHIESSCLIYPHPTSNVYVAAHKTLLTHILTLPTPIHVGTALFTHSLPFALRKDTLMLLTSILATLHTMLMPCDALHVVCLPYHAPKLGLLHRYGHIAAKVCQFCHTQIKIKLVPTLSVCGVGDAAHSIHACFVLIFKDSSGYFYARNALRCAMSLQNLFIVHAPSLIALQWSSSTGVTPSSSNMYVRVPSLFFSYFCVRLHKSTSFVPSSFTRTCFSARESMISEGFTFPFVASPRDSKTGTVRGIWLFICASRNNFESE